MFLKHGLFHLYSERKSSLKVTSNAVEKPHNLLNDNVSILEIGFGTGLNTFITLLEAEKLNLKIDYVGVEAFPVSMDEVSELDYSKQLKVEIKTSAFNKLHEVPWEKSCLISDDFKLTKRRLDFSEIRDINTYDLIYFDAFGARVQPELWTETIFRKMYNSLKENGILVTYSAKGSVRRAMKDVGFAVERLDGPPGKREMLRAKKLNF